jgi:hypothetical protein
MGQRMIGWRSAGVRSSFFKFLKSQHMKLAPNNINLSLTLASFVPTQVAEKPTKEEERCLVAGVTKSARTEPPVADWSNRCCCFIGHEQLLVRRAAWLLYPNPEEGRFIVVDQE